MVATTSWPRRLSARFALVIVGVLLAGAILEMGLRLMGFQTSSTHSKQYTRYHPMFGWEKIPEGGGWFHRPEYRTYVRFNSKGLRDQEHPYEKRAGTFRVLILGDSFVEGYSVDSTDLVSEILETELNKARPGPTIEVINGGTSGYSTDQEFLFYREEGAKYTPDLVILMMFHNDIYYNAQPLYRDYAKPLFVVQDGQLALTNVPLPVPTRVARDDADEENADAQSARRGAGGVFSRTASHLLSYRLVGQQLRLHLPDVAEGLRQLGLMQAVAAPKPKKIPQELSVFARMETPAFTAAWTATEAILQEFSRVAQASGAELLLFLIPDKAEVYAADWEATQKAYDISTQEWDPATPNSRIKDIAQRLGLRMLDPLPAFQQAASQGERLYYRQDGHWNARGHQLAAQLIQRYLVNHDLLTTTVSR
jgi:lysophospholipase L1-like esterase